MNIWKKMFSKTEQKIDDSGQEKKSIIPPQGLSFTEFLINNGDGDLAAFSAVQLYMKAMPLFNAVSLRSQTFSQIPIRVWDRSNEEFVNDHPALDLLRNPNSDVSQIEFLEQVCSYYDITGDSFIVATGRLANPPLELATVPPQTVTFGTGSKFGILHVPDQIWVTLVAEGRFQFNAKEIPDKGIHFVNSLEDKEIWHIRTFNPRRSSTNFRGMSTAQPVWFELQQYIAGNNTNLSLLKRGTKLSLAWVNNRGEELTDKQWERMQEEAQKYSGDLNAGGTPILDGMDVKAIQQTNRDMEFKDLQEAMLSRTSTVYRIPLALLLAQSMTLNNLETSMVQLFDNSVLPLANKLYSELTRLILSRYPDSENLEFRFNEQDIPALRSRMIQQAKTLSEVNVNTVDELRGMVGFENLPQGGDVVLKPATLIPIGSDEGFDLDEEDEDDIGDPIKSKFKKALRTRGIDDETIEIMAREAGL